VEVELHAKVSGYLDQMNVDFGDKVKAGQLLACWKSRNCRTNWTTPSPPAEGGGGLHQRPSDLYPVGGVNKSIPIWWPSRTSTPRRPRTDRGRRRGRHVALCHPYPYLIIVICLITCVVGVTSLVRMPVDLFPPIKIPVVVVATFYSGMPPEQIENDITGQFERMFTLARALTTWSRVR
jgi:hypothetical protein